MKKKIKISVSIIVGIALFYFLEYIADYIFPWFSNKGKLLTIINLLLPVIFIIGGSILGAKLIYKKLPNKK